MASFFGFVVIAIAYKSLRSRPAPPHCQTHLFHTIALPCFSVRCLCSSSLSIPLPRKSPPDHSVAALSVAQLCRGKSPPGQALPLLCAARLSLCLSPHCCAVPMLSVSQLFRCAAERFVALPLPRRAQLFRCPAAPCIAVASRHTAIPLRRLALLFRCVTGSPPRQTGLFHCSATGRCRRSGHSPAIPGRPFRDRRRGRPPGTRR